MNKVDVIIPAYNAHDTIVRTLCSIACQTIREDIKVTIVNDASDHDYSQEISRFKDYLDIVEVGYAENQGPGFARNFGYSHSSNPFVTFIDADDTFYGSIALNVLRMNLLADPKSHTCVGVFLEEQAENRFNGHVQDLVWMFGKMYRRDWLDHHSIRMNSTRSNEDTGFNKLIMLCSNENEQIKFIQDPVYIWHATKESITRAKDCDYSFNASFGGYTDNMIWCITEARKRFPFKEQINYFIVECLCQLYFYFVESHARKPEYDVQNWNHCVRYYNEVYRLIEGLVTDEVLMANYNLCATNFYKSGRNNGFIPHLSIQQFVEKLKNN